jgi:hypothetical protein
MAVDLGATEKAGDKHLSPATVQALGALAHHPGKGVLQLVLNRAVGFSEFASSRLIDGGILTGRSHLDGG